MAITRGLRHKGEYEADDDSIKSRPISIGTLINELADVVKRLWVFSHVGFFLGIQ